MTLKRERYLLCHGCGTIQNQLKPEPNVCSCESDFTYLDNCTCCDEVTALDNLNDDGVCDDCVNQAETNRFYEGQSYEHPL